MFATTVIARVLWAFVVWVVCCFCGHAAGVLHVCLASALFCCGSFVFILMLPDPELAGDAIQREISTEQNTFFT